jgi:hypothetical protein
MALGDKTGEGYIGMQSRNSMRMPRCGIKKYEA